MKWAEEIGENLWKIGSQVTQLENIKKVRTLLHFQTRFCRFLSKTMVLIEILYLYFVKVGYLYKYTN